MFFVLGFARLPKRCCKSNCRFLAFFCRLTLSLRSSMIATYRKKRSKSKNYKKRLTSCQSERFSLLRTAIKDRFFLISSFIKARSMLGLCLARDFSIRDRTNLGSVRCENFSSSKRELQQFNAVTSLWSLASFLRLDNFCPQAKKMCFLLLYRAISFMNFRATATVGTWVAHLNGCRTESSNTFPNL